MLEAYLGAVVASGAQLGDVEGRVRGVALDSLQLAADAVHGVVPSVLGGAVHVGVGECRPRSNEQRSCATTIK